MNNHDPKTPEKLDRALSVFGIFLASGLAATAAACGGENGPQAEASNAPDDAEAVAAVDEIALEFEDIDMDDDAELSAIEFRGWSAGPVFSYYMQREVVEDPTDVDQTGPLDPVVFIDALYDAWDINADGALDETEWDAATRVIESLSDTDAAWVEFDIDENGVIDVEEVHTRLEDDDVLAAIDSDEDGNIEEEELNAWFFAAFDLDDDGTVSRDEWRLAEQYFDVPIL